jgi:2-desacetyl-2-hydroxyethyl bacteriochlorophyllide A dehydrogenase
MKAIQFSAKARADTAELPVPMLVPGHVLVRIRAAGLCHTDIEVLHGRYGVGAFPLVPGHEYSGTVEAAADDVKSIKVGDRVAVDPNIPCGECRSCKNGLTNLCSNLQAYGVTRNGGFAEFSLVAADHVHPIDDLPFDTAALAEPLACVLTGIGTAGLDASRTQNALVFGAGPIGLLLALATKAKGVKMVTVVDISEQRLAFADELGLDTAMSGSAALRARERDFDFVADATGVPQVTERMTGYTADGGTALVFGVCPPDARIAVAPFEIFRRQLHIVGSHSLNRNIPEAIRTLQHDDGTMAKLISHRLPLAEVLPFIVKGSADPAAMKVQFVAD